MRFKALVILALAFWAALSMTAQAGPLSFGLKGGINLARYQTEGGISDLEYSSLMRFGGGITLSWAVSDVVSIDTDFLYLQKGLRSEVLWDESGFYHGSEDETRLAYAVASPMLKIGGRGNSFTPYGLAGVEFGYLLSAELWSDSWNGNPDQSSENEYDIKDQLEEIAWGLTFGGGIEIPTGGASAFVEARYVMGMSNIWPSDYQTMGEQKSRDIYLMGGFRF